MTRFPHDQFAKDFLESLLSPLGQVQTSLKISQERAIQEVAALPADHPYRNNALDLLGNLKIILEARETIEPEEQELIMQLSPLYLEKLQEAQQIGEQRGEIKGRQDFVLRLLKKRVGDVSTEVLAMVMDLSLEQLDDLYDAALDFTKVSDLISWLDLNG